MSSLTILACLPVITRTMPKNKGMRIFAFLRLERYISHFSHLIAQKKNVRNAILYSLPNQYFFVTASSVALSKLDRYKKTFPEDFSPVKSGGWYNLQQLAENPKEKFVEFVVEGLKQTESSDATEISVDEPKLEALVNLLYASAKGFEADLVDGDWVLVFSQNGDKVTKFASIDKESGDSVVDNVFDIKTMTFSNIATISKRAVMMSRGKVR